MKTVHYNPRRVTVEGGSGGDWLPLILAVVAVLLLAGSAATITAYAAAVWHVLRIALWLAGALVFSGLLAWGGLLFSRQEQRRLAAKSQVQVERVPDWAARGRLRP